MKHTIQKMIQILTYFLTPEDSSRPVRYGVLAVSIGDRNFGLGSIKSIFWIASICLAFILVTLI